MSYTDFSVLMRLVDVEYTHTKSYSQLHIDMSVYLSTDQVWTQILRGRETYVCRTSKASALGRAAFKYLYAILSWKLLGEETTQG